ncbi:hypothetical protein, partial [Lysinibacillus sp. NPDC086135]|uniref:hypothetical protein n=1 Tax=Lysinibacillus sp. NPDC086135 TaxID=3364130 RepID=UPI0038057159
TLPHKRHLLLPLRFRTKDICCCRYASAQKTSAAAATLPHKRHLLLPLRFRTKDICCCRYAAAQKTSAGPSTKPIPDTNYAGAQLIAN